MAKLNKIHIPWGLIALLSFIISGVAFAIPYPPLVIILTPICIISSVVAWIDYINILDKAETNPFDDHGYC